MGFLKSRFSFNLKSKERGRGKVGLSKVVDRLIINRLRRDRKHAEALIKTAFPGYALRKIRKDAGLKKGANNAKE